MRLFIDDQRLPQFVDWVPWHVRVQYKDLRWMIARSYDNAIECMTVFGCPNYISFDHDLGHNQKTGYDIAKWMVERDLDFGGRFIPESFAFIVHSRNPVGKQNIEGLLNNFIDNKFGTQEKDDGCGV